MVRDGQEATEVVVDQKNINMYLEETAVVLQGKSNIDVHTMRVDVIKYLLTLPARLVELEERRIELISDRAEAVDTIEMLRVELKDARTRIDDLEHRPTGEEHDATGSSKG